METKANNRTSTRKTKKKDRIRRGNGLGELAVKFIRKINGQTDKIIDLNDAAKMLDVQKRRIYDITNVLETRQK